MRKIFFGILWLAITVFITFMFYSDGGHVYVNGVEVTHEEFNALLWPKLLFAAFIIIGIIVLIIGIKETIERKKSGKKIGVKYEEMDEQETYNSLRGGIIGIILDVHDVKNASYGNNKIAIEISGINCKDIIEKQLVVIKDSDNKYKKGNFVLYMPNKEENENLKLMEQKEIPQPFLSMLKSIKAKSLK